MRVRELAFVDVETTGLDERRHAIWEVAIITYDGTERDPVENVWSAQLLLSATDVIDAQPDALRIGRYYTRSRPEGGCCPRRAAAVIIAKLTEGRQLVGINPAFDAKFLTAMLRTEGITYAWNPFVIDVAAMVGGKLGLARPWRSSDITAALGLDPANYNKHTALDDARLARDIYVECVIQ